MSTLPKHIVARDRRRYRPVLFCTVVLLVAAAPTHAGLYYSAESFAELPSQWRGFLLDHRALRMIAIKSNPTRADNPMRLEYEKAAARLEKIEQERKRTADEEADLGAIYVRLGDLAKALSTLRAAQVRFPNHFRVAANLATAWQLQGEYRSAAANLRDAVRLAPGKFQKAEEYHLKLVELREREPRGWQGLDDLFGVHFSGDAGTLPAAERKKLPSDAVAIVQQLALWLPADGRLLWQLAELANAHGDTRTAAAMMDGCVTEFALHDPELRRHRNLIRAAVDQSVGMLPAGASKSAHQEHAGLFRPRSRRPLENRFDIARLPPINPTAVNPLPWALLTETVVAKPFRPAFAPYLLELDGKRIELSGFMQPLGEDSDMATFMLIEYPVGCWYCEMPELTGIVCVEMPPGKTMTFSRNLVKVTGELSLNATNPENFLYTIRKAKVSQAD